MSIYIPNSNACENDRVSGSLYNNGACFSLFNPNIRPNSCCSNKDVPCIPYSHPNFDAIQCYNPCSN